VEAAPAVPLRSTTVDVTAARFNGVSDAAHIDALRRLYSDVNPEKIAQVWWRTCGPFYSCRWRSGLVWSGLVWSGLVWSGLVWSGLVWCSLCPWL
jgi:hypothetical protein